MIEGILITIIGGILLTFILFVSKYTFNRFIKKNSFSDRADHDIRLFKKFLELLPSSSESIYFLKEHDLGNSFRGTCRDDLHKFIEDWDKAEFQFLNTKIELAKTKLYKLCSKFLGDLAYSSWPQDSCDFYTTLPDEYRSRLNLPEEFLKKIKDLNDLATQCYKAHQSFISLCKNILRYV